MCDERGALVYTLKGQGIVSEMGGLFAPRPAPLSVLFWLLPHLDGRVSEAKVSTTTLAARSLATARGLLGVGDGHEAPAQARTCPR